MLGNYCRDLGDYFSQKFSLALARFGAQTWIINLCAIVCAVGSSYFFISHNLYLALFMLFLNHAFDYMDGSIDRAKKYLGINSFRYRTIFHVLSDKLSEIIIFLGMIFGGYIRWELGLIGIVTCLILTMLGRWVYRKTVFDLSQSLFDRSDRLFVILLLCLMRQYNFALILVSIMNVIGIIQRLIALFVTWYFLL